MASLTGRVEAFSGDTSVIDTVQQHPVLTRAYDASGNEYIYLSGVASTAAKDAVVYDELGVTIRTVADSVGPVAIAMAATVASRWGWYQIFGKATGTAAAAVSDNKTLVLTSTAGALDDADVAGDQIIGCWSRSAPTGAGNITLHLNYPMCHDTAID